MSTISIDASPYDVLASQVPVSLSDVDAPSYGRYLEDFVPGTVFVHPRGTTIVRGMMLAYAKTFMEANPLYLNQAYAERQGHPSLPAAPHLVMNVALSLGVQNDSEKAIANLGYYDVRFLRPVYAGDSLMGRTRVVARRDRGVGKPGIATVETLAVNQRDEVVVQYRRKIFVPRRGAEPIGDHEVVSDVPFPFEASPTLSFPWSGAASDGLTLDTTRFEAMRPGRIVLHANGRTVTDEHVQWTYRVMNTHPLHYDRLYSTARSGPMSGEPIVYGGLVFAWLLGLSSRDISENAAWELGWHNGYHTQPTYAGDTLYAISRILAVDDGPTPALGKVRLQLIGLKNLNPRAALDTHGADLFLQENEKRSIGLAKIEEKIFEIEREILVVRGDTA